MCKWNTTVLVEANGKKRNVDKCIFELVKVLNDNGFVTIASCCGHGKLPGDIALKDGREIVIARNYQEARQIYNIFPHDIHGDKKQPFSTN